LESKCSGGYYFRLTIGKSLKLTELRVLFFASYRTEVKFFGNSFNALGHSVRFWAFTDVSRAATSGETIPQPQHVRSSASLYFASNLFSEDSHVTPTVISMVLADWIL
jgi:hypothetical protein